MYNGYGEANYAGGWILSPNALQPRRVESGEGMAWCDVHPGGRWVASSALM